MMFAVMGFPDEMKYFRAHVAFRTPPRVACLSENRSIQTVAALLGHQAESV